MTIKKSGETLTFLLGNVLVGKSTAVASCFGNQTYAICSVMPYIEVLGAAKQTRGKSCILCIRSLLKYHV